MPLKTIVIMFIVLGSSAPMAGERISQSMDVGKSGIINIYNERGNLEIEGWQQDKIKVEGELDSQTETFIFKNIDDITNIKIELSKIIRRGEGSNLRIFVPTDSQLFIYGGHSNINIGKISSYISVETTIGDISAYETLNNLSLKTISGLITISNTQGELDIRSVNGDINVNAESKKLKLKTISGKIHLKNSAAVEHGAITSVSGNVVYSGIFTTKSRFIVSNTVGNIELIPENATFPACEMRAGPGGTITNTLNQDIPMEALNKSLLLDLSQVDKNTEQEQISKKAEHLTCVVENDTGMISISTGKTK